MNLLVSDRILSSTETKLIFTMHTPVHRFRASNSAVSRVAVSEASQRIRTDDKGDSQQVDRVASPSSNVRVVNQEDEQFEWGEIKRGEQSSPN